MTRTRIVLGLFGVALVSGIAFIAISEATLVPMAAQGVGPGGVQVTASGWLALLLSGLGTGGFTLAGIVASIASRLGILLPGNSPDAIVAEFIELSESFAALMSDKSNRAAQRRFFFALVDSAQWIRGCETSHEGGIVVIKYSGYANPVAPAEQGAKP